MKRYLDSIVPFCAIVAVAGSLNIMLDSNQNLAKIDNVDGYKHALVSEGMLDANLVNKPEVQLITEQEKPVEETVTEEVVTEDYLPEMKPLPEGMETRTVNIEQLNVRTGDNKDTPIVTRVMEGDVVGLTGNTKDSWVEITVQDEVGTVGWVNGRYLK